MNSTAINANTTVSLEQRQEKFSADYAKFKKTLGDFEGMIINQLMSTIEKNKKDTMFSGGMGESIFTGELNRITSKRSSQAGGLGFKKMMEKGYGSTIKGQLRYKYSLTKSEEPTNKMLLESETKLRERTYETIG